MQIRVNKIKHFPSLSTRKVSTMRQLEVPLSGFAILSRSCVFEIVVKINVLGRS